MADARADASWPRAEARGLSLRRVAAPLAVLNAALFLLFLQVSAVRTPTALVEPVPLAPGVRAVAYDLDDATVRGGERIGLTLYLEGDPRRVRGVGLTLVRPANAPRADPVRVPGRGAIVERSARRLRLRLSPRGETGTFKLRLQEGRPFGLVHVTR